MYKMYKITITIIVSIAGYIALDTARGNAFIAQQNEIIQAQLNDPELKQKGRDWIECLDKKKAKKAKEDCDAIIF